MSSCQFWQMFFFGFYWDDITVWPGSVINHILIGNPHCMPELAFLGKLIA